MDNFLGIKRVKVAAVLAAVSAAVSAKRLEQLLIKKTMQDCWIMKKFRVGNMPGWKSKNTNCLRRESEDIWNSSKRVRAATKDVSCLGKYRRGYTGRQRWYWRAESTMNASIAGVSGASWENYSRFCRSTQAAAAPPTVIRNRSWREEKKRERQLDSTCSRVTLATHFHLWTRMRQRFTLMKRSKTLEKQLSAPMTK